MRTQQYPGPSLIKASLASLVILVTLILTACYGTFTATPAVPTGLSATTDQGDKIELNWTAASGAGVYLVYRDNDEEALASTSMTAFIDTDVEAERDYVYRVSALDIYGELESEPSEPATGATYGYTWQPPAALAAGVLDYAVVSGGGSVYAAWTLAGGTVVVKRWDSDQKAWLDFTSPGSWSGSSQIALIYQGRPVMAFSSTNGLQVIAYDSTDKVWETRGAAGFAAAGAVDLMLAADNTYTYLAFDNGGPKLWRYGSVGGWGQLDTGDSSGLPLAVQTPVLKAFTLNSGTPFAVIEYTDAGQKQSSYRFTAPAWQDAGLLAGIDAPSAKVSLLPQGAAIYTALRKADNSIHLGYYDQGLWTELTPTAGFPTAVGAPTPALVYHRQELHLLHADPTGAVIARRYRDSEWLYAGKNSGGINVNATDSIQAVSLNTRLFILHTSGGTLSVSLYE
ncbi:MAG: fibronectin type III domain-containing protein [Spirochaetes bacterium]|nr:fibronectin type III domain-containing protein [Spirochaetota bacterium]